MAVVQSIKEPVSLIIAVTELDKNSRWVVVDEHLRFEGADVTDLDLLRVVLALEAELCSEFLQLSNCSGSSWRSGAQAPYRSRLGWSAGALDHVLSPHTGSFHLYITGECFALPFLPNQVTLQLHFRCS